MTASGVVLGTPAYMPPEQAGGERHLVGPASDVYSLGMILYDLLTGQFPFEGPPQAMLAQVLFKAPEAPSLLRPGLSPVMDAICVKALAKKSQARFPTASAFAAGLVQYGRQITTARATACGPPQSVPPSLSPTGVDLPGPSPPLPRPHE